MKYLILEKGFGEGCDYSIGCNQRWKLVESDLPFEQFKHQTIKYALFGGDTCADLSQYTGCSDEIDKLVIVELPSFYEVDLDRERSNYKEIFQAAELQAALEHKRKVYERLKEELGEVT